MSHRLLDLLTRRRPSGGRRAPALRRRTAIATVLSLLAGPVLVLAVAAPAQAATYRPFEAVYSSNVNGDILLAANTLMTCGDSDACTTARSATTGNYSNNGFTMKFVDVDGDAATFNSSSAQLTIPPGGTVLFAGLTWGGRTAATDATNAQWALRGSGRFSVPVPGTTGQSHLPVVADAADIDQAPTDSFGRAYQAFVDVTDVVAAAGSGTYTMANVQSASGGTNQYAGWSLVVAIADPSAPARNLTVFTGFGSVEANSGGDSLTIPVSGFLTPPSGPVRTTMGAVVYEGDMGIAGDTFTLAGQSVGNTLSPTSNPFNSTITNRGAQVPTRAPAYNNQLGFDADLFTANGYLGNGATSASIGLTSVGDQYFPGVVTFATDLYDPKLLGTKTVTDLDGGLVDPGDVLRYQIPVENIGLDTAADSRFFDAIPTGTTYRPGTLTIGGRPQTDAADTVDNAQYVGDGNGHLIAYLGAGATPTRGGSIPRTSGTAQYVVEFEVTVDPDATHEQELINAAALTYSGQTTQASSASATNAVLSPVVTTPGAGAAPQAAPHILTFTPSPSTRTLQIPVLDGDTDTEGGALHVVAVTDAAGGTVTPNPDDTVTYAPRDDFAGRDIFTYTVEDPDGNRSTATVQVEVVNTAPTAVPDAVTLPGSTPRVVDVLTNDTDANGDALAVRRVDPVTSSGGTVTLVDGVVTYRSAAGFRGTDTFAYVVEDTRGGSDTASVTVTVTNNAPDARDDAVATQHDVAVPLALRDNDTDPDGDTLATSVVTPPGHGVVSLNPDGTGTYTPDPGWSGTDTFTYRAVDPFGAADTATVTVRVNGGPLAVDDARSTAADAPVDVAVLDNDEDPEDDALAVVAITQPAHGSTVQLAGGSVRYTPDAAWSGPDTFTYTVSDGRGLTDDATVTVTTANTDPVAHPDAASTSTDTSATAIDVLGNDTDVNIAAGVPGQRLTVTGATADLGATVVVASDGTLTVHPAPGYAGPVTVTYTISDGAGGAATGTLVVTVDNAAPTAEPDGPVHTPTDVSVLVDVLANDTDPNDDPLTIVPGSLTGPVSGPVDADGTARGTAVVESGQVRYTPPTGFAGTVTFDVTITDGHGGTATGTVTVVVDNAPPVAVDDLAGTASGTPVTVDVVANDTDPNRPGTDQALTVVAAIADHGAGVVLEADGRLTVTPAAGYEGPVTVTYTVSDGAGATDDGALVVTVANAVPVAGPDAASGPYLTAVMVDLLANDTDANPGDVLTVLSNRVGLPVDGSGSVRGTVSLAGGVATYTPPVGFSGPVTFGYVISDGTDEASGTVTVTVGNAPPVVTRHALRATTSRTIRLDVLATDHDPEGGELWIVAVEQPERGSLAIEGGKVLLYTPDPGWTGTVTLGYTVADAQGGLTPGTASLEVVASAVAPGGPGAAGTTGGAGAAELARTGVDVGVAVLVAMLLVTGGAAMTVVARRRRA